MDTANRKCQSTLAKTKFGGREEKKICTCSHYIFLSQLLLKAELLFNLTSVNHHMTAMERGQGGSISKIQ